MLAALASYCDARRHRGKWLLRIEDVDGSRAVGGAAENIISTLQRYGFRWDEEITYQSKRSAYYQSALALLQKERHLYPCACSRQRLHNAPLSVTGEPIYPGYCRINPPNEAMRPFAWRVIVPNKILVFQDAIQGRQVQNLKHECGDFILKRRDHFFAYHLAVVVDDIDQRITHVVRGTDIMPLTARQLHLYALSGKTPPAYAHIPIVVNQNGQKLSKQTRAPALPEQPLPALLAAWRFLEQPSPFIPPKTIDAFWEWAHANWNIALVPGCHAKPFFPEALRV